MTLYFSLDGTVPSKKNAWRRGNGNVYLPAQIQADIDALIIQAKSWRHKLDVRLIAGKAVSVNMIFVHSSKNKDLDNMFTTLLDVLQKAGILENDKLVRRFNVDEHIVPKGEREKVAVQIDVITRYPQMR